MNTVRPRVGARGKVVHDFEFYKTKVARTTSPSAIIVEIHELKVVSST